MAASLADARPVVALESTLIAHGLPRPSNLETARAAEAAVRAVGAVPATIAIWRGAATIGLSDDQLAELARRERCAQGQPPRSRCRHWPGSPRRHDRFRRRWRGAHAAGIRVFATGGIGGAHREEPFDISADLTEPAVRMPALVVALGRRTSFICRERWNCLRPRLIGLPRGQKTAVLLAVAAALLIWLWSGKPETEEGALPAQPQLLAAQAPFRRLGASVQLDDSQADSVLSKIHLRGPNALLKSRPKLTRLHINQAVQIMRQPKSVEPFISLASLEPMSGESIIRLKVVTRNAISMGPTYISGFKS